MKVVGGVIAAAVLAVGCGSGPKPAATPPVAPPASASAKAPEPDGWRESRPEPGPPANIDYPAAETSKLENGLTVYVARRPGGILSLSVVARGGAGAAPAGKSGVAALTARMMTEGTVRKNALAVAESIESMGATLDQAAARDSARLGFTVLKEDLRKGLALLSEVVREPAFPETELARVRTEWLDSIEAERQSPSRLSVLVGLRTLLGPVKGAPVSGSRTDVKGLGRADLVRFHRETFTPGNAALVVAGDVSLAEVLPAAKELFGNWKNPAGRVKPAPHPAEPATSVAASSPAGAAGGAARRPVLLVDRPGAVQAALFVAQAFPRRSDPGHEAREVLNGLLGGLFTSRLNMNLREKHAYTYGARSLDIATREWGALAVVTQVRTDVTAEALEEALAELKKVRDPALGAPITEAEVGRARSDLAQGLGATLSHTAELAGRVEDLFVHGLADDYHRKYPSVLNGILPQAIVEEARRVDPDRAVIVVVGDGSQVKGKLEARSFLVESASPSLTD